MHARFQIFRWHGAAPGVLQRFWQPFGRPMRASMTYCETAPTTVMSIGSAL